jgi:hypothetical protein
MKLCQSLRPKDFDLKALDKELTSMVLIRALPNEYSHFVSLLLLMDKLDKDTVQQAFMTEDITNLAFPRQPCFRTRNTVVTTSSPW